HRVPAIAPTIAQGAVFAARIAVIRIECAEREQRFTAYAKVAAREKAGIGGVCIVDGIDAIYDHLADRGIEVVRKAVDGMAAHHGARVRFEGLYHDGKPARRWFAIVVQHHDERRLGERDGRVASYGRPCIRLAMKGDLEAACE